MSLVRVKSKAQITLPLEVRRKLGVSTGDYLKVEVRGGEVILKPQAVADRFPTVRLSAEGQRLVEEAEAEIREGRGQRYSNVEELIEDLNRGPADQ